MSIRGDEQEFNFVSLKPGCGERVAPEGIEVLGNSSQNTLGGIHGRAWYSEGRATQTRRGACCLEPPVDSLDQTNLVVSRSSLEASFRGAIGVYGIR